MSKLKELKDCTDFHDIANLLGYKPKALAYILYTIPENQKYRTFQIPKKSGGLRTVKSPCDSLKKVQSSLSKLLHDCKEGLLPDEQRLVKDKNKQSPHRANKAISHGFKQGLSIASNAAKHKSKKYVFNLDIEDFFPSINFGRVRGYFIKNTHFQLPQKVATVIAEIACHENSLPQGSPCSPIISNLIGEILDIRLLKIAKKNKCTYSRYADDLTFSTNQKDFPKAIAFRKSQKKSEWSVGKELEDCILRSGFAINPPKTRTQYDDSRQVVTGLVVNKVVNTKSEYYRNARAMCNSLFMTGSFHLPKTKVPKDKMYNNLLTRFTIFLQKLLSPLPKAESDAKSDKSEEDINSASIQQLEGILSHIYYIKNYRNKYAQEGYRKSRHDGIFQPPDHKKNSDELPVSTKYPPRNRSIKYTDESHKVSVDGIKNLYSKFLFFKHFYILNKPLIICEGKTDNIYLRSGLKKLVTDYPSLIQNNKNKKRKHDPDFLFNINFLNKTDTMHEMLKMAEGASGLKYIMLGYKRLIEKYKCKGKLHPVIMIVDNDKAGNDLITASQKKRHPFIHFVENLYIIQLPKIKDSDTELEDYFDDAVKQEAAKQMKGSSFKHSPATNDSSKKLSEDDEPSKAYLSQYVKKNWKSINFDEFTKVYELIKLVIGDYERSNWFFELKLRIFLYYRQL